MREVARKSLVYALVPIVAYVALAHVGIYYNLVAQKASLVWPASGFACFYFFRYRWKVAPALYVGAVVANFANGSPFVASCFLGIEALLQAWAFAVLMDRWKPATKSIGSGVFRFSLVSAAAGLIGAASGAATLWFNAIVDFARLPSVISTWWWGDSVGIFLVYSILDEVLKVEFSWRRALEKTAIFVALCLAATAFFVFPQLYPFFAVVFFVNVFVFRFCGKIFSLFFPLVLLFVSLSLQLQNVGPFATQLHDAELEYKIFFLTLIVSTSIYSMVSTKKLLSRFSIVILTSWAVAGSVYYILYNFELEKENQRLRQANNFVVHSVVTRFQRYEDALIAGASFVANDKRVDDRRWAEFIADYRLVERYPGINGMGVIEVVPRSQIDAFEIETRRNVPGRPFVVHPVPLPGASLRPQSNEAFVVTHIEPYRDNEAARGLDVASEASRYDAAVRARKEKRFTLTGKIALVQDRKQGAGFLLYYPVEIDARFVGWIYSPLIAERFFTRLFHDYTNDLSFRVYFGASVDESKLLYSTGGTISDLSELTSFVIGGQSFLLSSVPNPAKIQRQIPFAMIFGSLIVVISFLVVSILRNLESIKERAEELARSMTIELRNANHDLQVAALAKSAFLANMSHEIRTPINAIVGLSELLLTTNVNDEQKKWLKGIKSSSEGLVVVVNDILDLSKIEAERIELESAWFSLFELVEELETLYAFRSSEKSVEFLCEHNLDSATRYRGDKHRLKQVLINLLSNAMKFTAVGYVRLRVRDLTEGRVSFEIEDTGIGIDPGAHEKIFEAFTQADVSTTRQYGGTGLGLTISQRLVALMNGKISVDSQLGRGSKFSFEIPLEKTFVEVESTVGETDSSVTKSYDILVVEDNKLNQMVVKTLIEKMGHRVTLAFDGEQSVEVFLSRRFDLVFMDCQMPVCDGYEATLRIRAAERERGRDRIPIVALTANARVEEVERCLQVGMDGVLTKPVTGNDIQRTIRERLESNPSA